MRLRIAVNASLLKLFKEAVLLCRLSKTCRQCYTYEWGTLQPMEWPLWSDQCQDTPSPLYGWILVKEL